MRKVHVKVMLDVLVHADEDVDIGWTMAGNSSATFELNSDKIDVVDTTIESFDVIDSR